LIFGLLTWSLASGYFPQEYPTLSAPLYWGLALITSLLFFGSVLAHELGHVYLALRNGIPVKGITLFIFEAWLRLLRNLVTLVQSFASPSLAHW
jgi:Zn-dependent protease